MMREQRHRRHHRYSYSWLFFLTILVVSASAKPRANTKSRLNPKIVPTETDNNLNLPTDQTAYATEILQHIKHRIQSHLAISNDSPFGLSKLPSNKASKISQKPVLQSGKSTRFGREEDLARSSSFRDWNSRKVEPLSLKSQISEAQPLVRD